MRCTKLIRVYGRVQGVFFRESMCQVARQAAVTGWVRNRSDGSVEAVVCGEEQAVASVVEWARHGPERAGVNLLEVNEGSGDYTDFQRLPTI